MIACAPTSKVRVLLVSGLLAIGSIVGLSAQSAPQTTKKFEFDNAQMVDSYGKRPLNFRASTGQTDQGLNSISPAHSRVRYGAASRDADLLYFGNERQLENNSPLPPDTDPKTIPLQFSEVAKLTLDAHGSFSPQDSSPQDSPAQDGDFAFRKSHAYQENDVRRGWFAGRFTLGKHHPLNFSLSGYAPPQPLAADPVLIYCADHGECGSYGTVPLAMAVD
jgi:hypothetical protein